MKAFLQLFMYNGNTFWSSMMICQTSRCLPWIVPSSSSSSGQDGSLPRGCLLPFIRLLERSAKVSDELRWFHHQPQLLKNTSSDISALYRKPNVISITDGQIFLYSSSHRWDHLSHGLVDSAPKSRLWRRLRGLSVWPSFHQELVSPSLVQVQTWCGYSLLNPCRRTVEVLKQTGPWTINCWKQVVI